MSEDFPGSVYGEITNKGTDKLIDIFKSNLTESDIFYDLGSGKGKLAIDIASKTSVKKVFGIELHKERFNESINSLKDLNIDNVSFINKDFLDVDLSKATIVYYANEGIPKPTNDKVWDKLSKGCLLICGRRVKALENQKKYKLTEPIEKTYTSKRGNWYIIKE